MLKNKTTKTLICTYLTYFRAEMTVRVDWSIS